MDWHAGIIFKWSCMSEYYTAHTFDYVKVVININYFRHCCNG